MIVRRATFEAVLAERDLAVVDRDHWQQQAEVATASAATVVKAVDSALCALGTLHAPDERGICSCGHPSPCPTGLAVQQLMPYWEHVPPLSAPYVEEMLAQNGDSTASRRT